jgi:hypothetical protein
MTNEEQVKSWEDSAFYESGLIAHGCLEKLDSYTREAIERYGRYLLDKQLKSIQDGFKGCCYACEPVALLNIDLEKQLNSIYEDGTAEHNAAVELRQKLAQSLFENDKLKAIAKKLYGVALHVYEVAKYDPVVIIGPSLFDETHKAIEEYEQTNDIREI